MKKRPNARERMPKAMDGSDRVPSFRMGMSFFHGDSFSPFRGEVFWELRDGKTGEVQQSGHMKNVVTLDASILVARLMKSPPTPNLSEPDFGAYALAVGTGDGGWDPMNPPTATNTQRSLYNELGRKQFASTDFIDSEGSISAIPTKVIDVTTIFAESEAVGPIVEMGILGGDVDTNMSVTNPVLPANGIYDATVDLVGKDTLVNYLTFPVINKPATSTLSWTWRLTFGLLLWIGCSEMLTWDNGLSSTVSHEDTKAAEATG